VEERAQEQFRQGIAEAQPWYPQVQALAEIDRLAALSDGEQPEALQAGRAAPEPAAPRRSPAVAAERQEIFRLYSGVAGKVAQGVANAQVIGALREVLGRQQRLQATVAVGSADWRDLEEQRGYVTESVGRAYRILRQGPEAIASYQEAGKIWHRLGEDGQEASCTAKLAELALLEDADVDQVRGALVVTADRDPDPADPAALTRVQALTSLAALHVAAHDDFQARLRLREAAAGLGELGFADPQEAGLEQAFLAWVQKARDPVPNSPSGHRFLPVLAAVLGMWESLLTTRIALGDDGDGSISPLLRGLAAYAAELRPQAQQARAAFAPALARLGIDPSAGAGQAAEAGWTEAADKFRQLDEICAAADRLKDELDRRTGAGEDTAGLAPDAEAYADSSFRIGLPSLGVGFSILAADALITAGRFAEAVPVLEARRALLLAAPGFAAADRRASSVALLTREALAVARLGDFEKLSHVCGAGIAEVEQDRYKVSAPHMQDTYLRDRINLYRVGVFAEWKLYERSHERGHIETLLERAELSKAHSGLGWLSSPGSTETIRQPDVPAARARFDELTSDQAGDPAVTAARRRAIWDELMAAQVRSRHPTSAWPAFDLAAVQRSLDADEAILYYYWLNTQTLLVAALDRTTVEIERVPLDPAARNRLDDLVSQSIQTPQGDFATGFAEFTETLLPPKLTPLIDGKRRLVVSPHRVLHQLPLPALPWNGEPLSAKFAVTVVPNLTSLLLSYRPAGRGVLAVGVARPAGEAEALPSAPVDAKDIAALYLRAGYPATTLLDAEATRARLEHLASRDFATPETRLACLHIATHGTSVLSQTPMESSLSLADGPVDGLDVARWSLAADLVVLSACWSGQQATWDRDDAGELIGDEMLGLPAAFMAAGAHQVIGTLWKVRDDVAHRVTTRLHRELLAGQTAQTALRLAVLAERDATGDMAGWGAFQLIAVGRAEPAMGPGR
jgi:CHAT domain